MHQSRLVTRLCVAPDALAVFKGLVPGKGNEGRSKKEGSDGGREDGHPNF